MKANSSKFTPPRPPAKSGFGRLGLIVLLLAILAVAIGGTYAALHQPPGAPAFAPGGPPAPAAAYQNAAAYSLGAWQHDLSSGDWQSANLEEDRLVGLGDVAVPGLMAAFTAEHADANEDAAAATVRRQRLAAVLGRINSQAAVDALLQLLQQKPLPEVCGQLYLALAKTGPAFDLPVGPVLRDVICDEHEPEDTRSSLATLLAKRGSPVEVRWLCQTAENPESEPVTRKCAIVALGFVPPEKARRENEPEPDSQPVRALHDIVSSEPDDKLLALAVEALGRRNEPEAEDLLVEVSERNRSAPARLAAVQAMGQRPLSETVRAALAERLVADAKAGVSAAAAMALGQPGQVENLPALQAGMLHKTPIYVQLKIVEAMENIGGEAAVKRLKMLGLATDPNASAGELPTVVKSAVTAALDRLEHPGASPPPPPIPRPPDDF